jgi:hypothetical protein
MQDPQLYEEFRRRLVDLSKAQPLAGNNVDILKRYFEFDISEVRLKVHDWSKRQKFCVRF